MSIILIVAVIDTNPIVKMTICLKLPKFSDDIAIPKYLFIPRCVFSTANAAIIITSDTIAFVNPIASAPATLPTRNQKTSVDTAIIMVLIEVKNMFLPIFGFNRKLIKEKSY
jgi:hypothetical protein